MPLNDREISFRSRNHGMIAPFVGRQVSKRSDGHPMISYGLSSYGYDVRLGETFIKYEGDEGQLDPKYPETWPDAKTHESRGAFMIEPHGFALGHTVEVIKVPRECLVVCLGKSTYARLGLIVNVTPLEPEWEGQVTLELSNTTNYPVFVYPNEGIAQLVFYRAEEGCLISYADRLGKYQHQSGVVEARLADESRSSREDHTLPQPALLEPAY